MSWRGSLKVALLLAILPLYLFSGVLADYCVAFCDFRGALLLSDWLLLPCLSLWCGTLIFFTFRINDSLLLVLLLIAMAWYYIVFTASAPTLNASILLAGLMLGKGAAFALVGDDKWRMADGEKYFEPAACQSTVIVFLVVLVALLAFASVWNLKLPGSYHGPRWIGLWDNPNIYGMLMGAGLVLASGLLVQMLRQKLNLKKFLPAFLFASAGMMAIGLLFSYSRGAWVGTLAGLWYLAKTPQKNHNWLALLGIVIAAGTVVAIYWHATADTDHWYIKRLDFSRPSTQHRVAAWHGSIKMMHDHPLGVGWNHAVELYYKQYSPPEGGAAALTMNSYLMLGTELGLPGLLCFVAYVVSCYRRDSRPYPAVTLPLSSWRSSMGDNVPADPPLKNLSDASLRTVCLAGALVFVIAFWFDGGLFDLPTAALFWIFLELGAPRPCLVQLTSFNPCNSGK